MSDIVEVDRVITAGGFRVSVSESYLMTIEHIGSQDAFTLEAEDGLEWVTQLADAVGCQLGDKEAA